MYDDFKVANYSKALLSPELFARHLSRLYTGDVVDGLTVTPGTGLQVVLAPGNTFIRYGSAAVASARLVSLVNNFNLTIGTPDASNPRLDLVVAYIDNAVSLPSGVPTAANLDGKGVAKSKIIQGTPAAVPSEPNGTAIQASVGAGNPYTVLAQIRVNAGVSVIASSAITDKRITAKIGSDKVDWATLNVSFSAHAASAQTIPGGSGGVVNFATALFNYGSGYNPATSTFTAPIKGVYTFSTTVGTDLNVADASAAIEKNGAVTVGRDWQSFVNGYKTANISKPVELNAGDTIKVRLVPSANFRTIADQSWASFSGVLDYRT